MQALANYCTKDGYSSLEHHQKYIQVTVDEMIVTAQAMLLVVPKDSTIKHARRKITNLEAKLLLVNTIETLQKLYITHAERILPLESFDKTLIPLSSRFAFGCFLRQCRKLPSPNGEAGTRGANSMSFMPTSPQLVLSSPTNCWPFFFGLFVLCDPVIG